MPTTKETEALAFLREPHSCTELGEHLWAKRGPGVNRQSYARPAGKLIKRLLAKGLVVRAWVVETARRRGIRRWGPALYVASDTAWMARGG